MSSLPLLSRLSGGRPPGAAGPALFPSAASPSSSASAAAPLCPCAALSTSDRVVVFLVLVAALWLSGLVLYIHASRTAPLTAHAHHNVHSRGLDAHLPQQPQLPWEDEEGHTAAASPPPKGPTIAAPPAVRASASASSASFASSASQLSALSWAAMPSPAVIVLTYNRPTYLRQTLDALPPL